MKTKLESLLRLVFKSMNADTVFNRIKSIVKGSICPVKKDSGVLVFSLFRLFFVATIVALCAFLIANMVGGFGQLMSILSQDDPDTIMKLLPAGAQVVILVAYIVVSLVSVLIEVAFAYAMHFFKKGQELSFSSGLVRVKEKFFQVFLWTFIILALTTIIDSIGKINPVFSLFGSLLSFGFGLALYFLSPVLALEEGGSLNMEFKKSAESFAFVWKEVVLVWIAFVIVLGVTFIIAFALIAILSSAILFLLKGISVYYITYVAVAIVVSVLVLSFVIVDFVSMSFRLSLYEFAREKMVGVEGTAELN